MNVVLLAPLFGGRQIIPNRIRSRLHRLKHITVVAIPRDSFFLSNRLSEGLYLSYPTVRELLEENILLIRIINECGKSYEPNIEQ